MQSAVRKTVIKRLCRVGLATLAIIITAELVRTRYVFAIQKNLFLCGNCGSKRLEYRVWPFGRLHQWERAPIPTRLTSVLVSEGESCSHRFHTLEVSGFGLSLTNWPPLET